MNATVRPDECYFAVNLRADGPIPGLCSMQVLDLTLVGISTAGRIEALPASRQYRHTVELRPLGRPFEANGGSSWLAAESLRLASSGMPVGEAMVGASGWIREVSGTRRAVPITWPGGIEGVHLEHYFSWRGDGSNPFVSSRLSTNAQLVHQILGEDRTLIAGIRGSVTAPVAADELQPAARTRALSGVVGLLSSFR